MGDSDLKNAYYKYLQSDDWKWSRAMIKKVYTKPDVAIKLCKYKEEN